MRIVSPTTEILSNPATGAPYTKEEAAHILKHLELCARNCYHSEDKITEASAQRMLRTLLLREHESPIEHVSVSVRFICDRGVSHEIVRHRIASYSQESTRYCNYSHGKFGDETAIVDLAGGLRLDNSVSLLHPEQIDAIYDEWSSACADAERHYFKMLELGATPQIARSVLNNSLKTDLIVTMNMREWRHFFKLRCANAAHPQMREVALDLLRKMYDLFDVVFEDLYQEFISGGSVA